MKTSNPPFPADPSQDASGRGDACVQAFREQFDFVHRCVRRYGASSAEADDLVQEVFIAMWRRWSDYDGSRPLRPWLAGISFRVVRCHVRRRRPDSIDAVTSAPGERPGADIAEVADAAARSLDDDAADEARALVLSAIERLPERHRLPLVMHELDELSPSEIAKLLAVPLATVYTRVRRARLAFEKALQEVRPLPALRRGGAAALLPPGLLSLERTPPVAPAGARARAEAFARAVVTQPVPPPDPLADELPYRPGAARLAPGVKPALLVAGALAVAAGLGLLALRRPPAERAAAVVAAKPDEASEDRVGWTRKIPSKVPELRVAPNDTAASYSPEVARGLGQGLTGYWPLDDGPGAHMAHDHSGAKRHCRLREPTSNDAWVEGVRGRALFLGATTWLQCPQPTVQREQPAELTIAAWVKRRSERTPAAIVTRQIGLSFEDHFFLGFKTDTLRVTSHAWHGLVSAAAPPPSERWHHTAFTRERDGTTRLYLDGVEVGHAEGGPRGTGPIDSPLTIGAGQYSRNPAAVRQRLDGAVDEILVYDRALAAVEIRALAAGVAPIVPGSR